MSRENQIEEIKQLARDIFEPKVAVDGIDLVFATVHGADRDNDTHFMRIARHLYSKGYRKAYDVAREFFNKIKELPRTKDFTVRSQDFKFGYMNAIQDILDEFKKKYESEGEK